MEPFKPGDLVYVPCRVVDVAGAGNIHGLRVQTLEGVRPGAEPTFIWLSPSQVVKGEPPSEKRNGRRGTETAAAAVRG